VSSLGNQEAAYVEVARSGHLRSVCVRTSDVILLCRRSTLHGILKCSGNNIDKIVNRGKQVENFESRTGLSRTGVLGFIE